MLQLMTFAAFEVVARGICIATRTTCQSCFSVFISRGQGTEIAAYSPVFLPPTAIKTCIFLFVIPLAQHFLQTLTLALEPPSLKVSENPAVCKSSVLATQMHEADVSSSLLRQPCVIFTG